MKAANRTEWAFKIFGLVFLGTTALLTLGFFLYPMSKLDFEGEKTAPVTPATADSLCTTYIQTDCPLLSTRLNQELSSTDEEWATVHTLVYDLNPVEQIEFTESFRQIHSIPTGEQDWAEVEGMQVILTQEKSRITIVLTND